VTSKFIIPKALLWAALGAQVPMLLTAIILPSTDLLLLVFLNVALLVFGLQFRHRQDAAEEENK